MDFDTLTGAIFVKGRCSRYEKITEELKAKAKEVGADAESRNPLF